MTPRYLAVQAILDVPDGGSGSSPRPNFLVVDTQNKYVIADCGDNQSRAESVAAALNITPA